MKQALLLLSVFAAVLVAQAQIRPPLEPGQRRAPRLDAIKSALALSDAQVEQLVQLQREQRAALRPVTEQLRDVQRKLRESLETSGPDPAGIGQLVLDAETLRRQTREIHESFHSRAVEVLGLEQQEKLKTIEEAVRLQPAIGQARALNLLAPQSPQAPGAVFATGIVVGRQLGRMRGGPR